MGTNYYAEMENERIHIGKNSSGWKFTINEDREHWRTPLDLFEFLKRSEVRIFDEYDRRYAADEMIGIIIRETIKPKNKTNDHERAYTVDGYQFHIGEFF